MEALALSVSFWDRLRFKADTVIRPEWVANTITPSLIPFWMLRSSSLAVVGHDRTANT